MIRRLIFSLLSLLIVVSSLFSQSDRVAGKIRGKVVDAETGQPLVGANIIILPTESGLGTAQRRPPS